MFAGFIDDFVVDVGEVNHLADGAAGHMPERAAQDVDAQKGAEVADPIVFLLIFHEIAVAKIPVFTAE